MGDNEYGQSGQGDYKFLTTPTYLLSDVAFMTAPNKHDTLILKTDGSIWGWGWDAGPNNPNGLWGRGRTHGYIPTEYTPNHQFLTLVKDYLKAPDGEVVQYMAWAGGYQQQPELTNKRVVDASWTYVLLGGGILYTRKTQTHFVRFSNMTNFVSLKGDDPHGALDTSGNLWIWGQNGFGQLGNGKVARGGTPNPNEEVLYKSLTKLATYAVSDGATYAIRTDGTVWGWGGFPIDNERISINRQVYPKWLFNADGALHISTPSQPNGDLKGNTYETIIRGLLAKGIIYGFEDNTFRPKDKITQAEFVQSLVLAMKWPHVQKTSAYGKDVPQDHWSNPYIAAALQRGVLRTDESYEFDKDHELNRSSMAIMVARTLNLKGESSKKKIKDQTPYWNQPKLIQAVVNKGIMHLNSKGAFNPYDYVTREEAAVTIYRMMQMKK